MAPTLLSALLASGSLATPAEPLPASEIVNIQGTSTNEVLLPIRQDQAKPDREAAAEAVSGPEAASETKAEIVAEPGTASQDAATPDAAAPDAAIPDAATNVIVVSGIFEAQPGDPLESVNAEIFELSMAVNAALLDPVTEVYVNDVPEPLRNGLANFLRNLLEPVNFLNYLLQLRPGKALETLGRFVTNSTIGIGGLIDVASEEPFNLPYRRNGFANTLGYYGMGPGPFLVLPLLGATTLRDLVGNTLDQGLMPLAVGAPLTSPYYAIPAYAINSLEFRLEFEERITAIEESADPYFALRESYLCLREADIADLRNLAPPRDCSIEALMMSPGPEEGAALPEAFLTQEEQVTASPDPLPATAVPVARLVTEPVV